MFPTDDIEHKALSAAEDKEHPAVTLEAPAEPAAETDDDEPAAAAEPEPEVLAGPVEYVPEFVYAGCVGACGDPDTEGCARIDVQAYQSVDGVPLSPEETVCVAASLARARIAAGVATATDL